MTKLHFTKKALAMAISFVMVMGLALGFGVEKVYANNITLTVASVSTTSVTFTINQALMPGTNFNVNIWANTTLPMQTLSASATVNAQGTHTFTISNLAHGVNHSISISGATLLNNTPANSNTVNVTPGTGTGTGAITFGAPTLVSDSSGSATFRATVTSSTVVDLWNVEIGFVMTQNATPNTFDEHQRVWNPGNNFIELQMSTWGITDGTTRNVFAYYFDGFQRHYSPVFVYTHVPGRPTVSTDSNVTYSTSTGQISASGHLSHIGSSNVSEIGFVYSNTNTTPTLAAGGQPVSGSFKATAEFGPIGNTRSFSTSFAPDFSANSTSQTFYVRAYAINNQGISYGEVRQVNNVNPGFIAVQLGAFTPVGGTSVQSAITATGVSASNIFEWGIVYSTTVNNPAMGSSTANVQYILGPTNPTTTSANIVIDNLLPNTRYHARAFARTRNGNYVYSTARDFTTAGGMDISIFEPSAITHSSAVLSGNLHMVGSANIMEMGFIYSRINQTPTENDGLKLTLPNPREGNFNMDLTNLAPSTRYYIRAYARFGTRPNDIVYSEVRQFTTQINLTTLTIDFRDQTGHLYDTQSLQVFIGSRVDASKLNVPHNTQLVNDNWTHFAMENEFITVHVIPTGGQQGNQQGNQPGHQQGNQPGGQQGWEPPPFQQIPGYNPPGQIPGYNRHMEQPYMHGLGHGMFGPGNPVSYIEVAAMLYTLLANPHEHYTYFNPHSWNGMFTDVDYSNHTHAQIVNFVASRGFMIGSDDGRFLTNESLHRSTMAVIISEVLGLGHKYGTPEHTNNGAGFVASGHRDLFRSAFPDTDLHWSRGFVWMAVQEGLIGGFEDEWGNFTYRPDNFLTRAEVAAIFAGMFARSEMPMGFGEFIDVPREHWAYRVIMNAAVPN